MEKKKLLVLILAGVILIGSVSFAMIKITGKKGTQRKAVESSGSLSSLVGESGKLETTQLRIDGRISAINEGSLEVEDSVGETISLKINGSTPVLSIDDTEQMEQKQIADLRVTETVTIDYDEISKEVLLITVR